MAPDNSETVQKVFAAFNRGDVEAALETAQPDFEMDWSNSIGPLKGVYSGREELLEFWQRFIDAWEEWNWDAEEVIELDEDRLVVVNHLRLRGRGSGARVDATGAQLWTFRDGLSESVKLFQSKQEALAAAGS